MKKQKITKKKLAITILVTVVLLGIAIGIFLLMNNQMGNNLKKVIGTKTTVPTFVFSEQKANGWWAADNYNSKEHADEYSGKDKDKLSVASRNIFQSKDKAIDSCFVMYEYYDYITDTNALIKQKQDGATVASELIYNKLNTETTTIDTPEGVKSYELHEYAISGPGSKQMQRGMSFGYIDLSDGYISINGICPEGNQMSSTILGMKSISLVR